MLNYDTSCVTIARPQTAPLHNHRGNKAKRQPLGMWEHVRPIFYTGIYTYWKIPCRYITFAFLVWETFARQAIPDRFRELTGNVLPILFTHWCRCAWVTEHLWTKPEHPSRGTSESTQNISVENHNIHGRHHHGRLEDKCEVQGKRATRKYKISSVCIVFTA